MNPDDDHSFLTRVMAWQDGTLTDAERAAFEQELLASAEKRRLFADTQVRTLQAHELLRRSAYQSGESGAQSDKGVVSRPDRAWWRRPAVLGAAAALAIGGAVAALALRAAPDPETVVAAAGAETTGPALATLTYSSAAEWEDGRSPAETSLAAGSYALTAGTVRMSLAHDDTVATLAAPARFDLVPPGNIRLHEGRLSAHVSQPDAGFTVLTEALTVLDRGTVFGVEVAQDGQALVSVLEGKVDVHSPGATDMQRIEQGDSVTARPDNKEVLPGPSASAGFTDLWPLTLGVDQLSHLVEFIPPSHRIRWGLYRDDTRLFLLSERHSETLAAPLELDIGPSLPTKMRRDGAKPKRPAPLATGTRVSSYLLFFRPQEGTVEQRLPGGLSGSVTFSRPVLGIIANTEGLEASDRSLGLEGVTYPEQKRRGLENSKKPLQRDFIRISPDGRHVYFNLHSVSDSDQFRVLVKAR